MKIWVLFCFLCCHRFISFWFVFVLLRRLVCCRLVRRGAIRRLIVAFYLCGDDLDKQSRFDQSKISNYYYWYIEELKS